MNQLFTVSLYYLI